MKIFLYENSSLYGMTSSRFKQWSSHLWVGVLCRCSRFCTYCSTPVQPPVIYTTGLILSGLMNRFQWLWWLRIKCRRQRRSKDCWRVYYDVDVSMAPKTHGALNLWRRKQLRHDSTELKRKEVALVVRSEGGYTYQYYPNESINTGTTIWT